MKKIPWYISGAAVTAGVIGWWAESEWESNALAAVIAAATIAYTGFTYLLVRSADEDRAELRRRERLAHVERLLAVVSEMEQNQHRKGQTHAWHAHVAFERSALDAARQDRVLMPTDARQHLHEIETRISRFNAVAAYNQVAVRQGSGAADGTLTELAGHVHDSLLVAIPIVKTYVESLAKSVAGGNGS